MKILLFLLLAATAYAGPPMPLLSPRAASVPKSTPMFKPASETIAPLYPGQKLVEMSITQNINFFGCDSNIASCILYDLENVKAFQRAGVVLRLDFVDALPTQSWNWVATFEAPTEDRYVEFGRFFSVSERPHFRTYRSVESVGVAAYSATTRVKVSPAMTMYYFKFLPVPKK